MAQGYFVRFALGAFAQVVGPELRVTTHATMSEAARLAREHLEITARGDFDAVDANVTPAYFNHRCSDEPLDTCQRGPEGLKATIRWLHRAFADLRFEFHDVVVDGDRVTARVTLHARQHGPFVVHDSPDGHVTDAFPSNGRSFAVQQTQWFKIRAGAIAEHDAVRDDLGMAKQLGWIPPKPVYIIRMLLTIRREQRSQASNSGGDPQTKSYLSLVTRITF